MFNSIMQIRCFLAYEVKDSGTHPPPKKLLPLFPIPYSLFPIPYSLFPIPYSLFPIPYSLFPIPSSLSVNVGQWEYRRFRDDHCKFG
jgi:hypothetical protein